MTTVNPISFDANSTLGRIKDPNYDLNQQKKQDKEKFSRAIDSAENHTLEQVRREAKKIFDKISEPDFLPALERAEKVGVRGKFCEEFIQSVMLSIPDVPNPIENTNGGLMEKETYMYGYLLHAVKSNIYDQLEELAIGGPEQSLEKVKENLGLIERSVYDAAQNIRGIDLDVHEDILCASDKIGKTPKAFASALNIGVALKNNVSPTTRPEFTINALFEIETKILRERALYTLPKFPKRYRP